MDARYIDEDEEEIIYFLMNFLHGWLLVIIRFNV